MNDLMKKVLSFIPNQFILPLFVVGGLTVGLGLYTFYASRAWSYALDDPAVCVNCHVMAPSYQSWSHSSHAVWATCNDCHVPQNNIVSQYAFKAQDGLYHAAMFTIKGEPQVIRARVPSSRVIMENCVRCHTPLTTEMVRMVGRATYDDVLAGNAKACWDCHTQVPHTNISNQASISSPGGTPLPSSPAPKWLKEML